ncbi:hypothetical protein PBY51_024256 [Eleginops maclovinus]|uniref:Uncharacterized protein n=1 Tax=Eleginops maclovinus TaxID=56733 RepID=A0AAN8AUQ8_ELEMC|nr:hypothetical protein PBY51_024256 [Eleginops maclovinus]
MLIHTNVVVLGGAGCRAERFVREVKVMLQCCDLLTESDKTLLLSPYVKQDPVPEPSSDPGTCDPACQVILMPP